jgi:hypothetical protein
LIENGSITARSSGDLQSALATMKRVTFDRRMAFTSSSSMPLYIQKEIVDEHRTLDATSAGEALAFRMDMVAQQHEEELSQLQRDNEVERNRTQDEINQLKKEKRKLVETARPQPDKAGGKVPIVSHNIYMHLTIDELLKYDSPPPYEPRPTSQINYYVNALVEVLLFALTLIAELQALAELMISKALRLRLRKGYSRIEWTCVGD